MYDLTRLIFKYRVTSVKYCRENFLTQSCKAYLLQLLGGSEKTTKKASGVSR